MKNQRVSIYGEIAKEKSSIFWVVSGEVIAGIIIGCAVALFGR